MAASQYPIRAVSRMTGLSTDTLRAWERRYQAVVPDRGERGRVYTDRHITRLKLIASLVERGHSIGSIAALSDAELRRLTDHRAGGDPTSSSALDLDPLLRAAKHYDLAAMETTLNRYALLLPPTELIFGVVLPVLRELGKQWESGSINPAQEHLVSSIFRGMLGSLLRSMPRPARASRIVFAAPSGERHELGLLCGAVLAAVCGYAVIYLGPDLPAADIAHAVRESGAKILVLSATAAGPVDDAGLGRLRRLSDDVAVWAGGGRAEELRSAIGSRVRLIDSLEQLRQRCEQHA